MTVPFLNLRPCTEKIKKQYLQRLEVFLSRSNFILTEEVSSFEQAFAASLSAAHCVGVGSGADAIYLALRALEVGPGDEVITQGNAYNASVTSIMRTGATPRFADIHADTLTIDAAKIIPLINSKTKAILPVHLFGQATDMSAIMDIAKMHKLFVVEDCAQAYPAVWQGKPVGTYGDIGCFSFYPTKNLGAFGDAGAIVTADTRLAETIKILRNLGQVSKNDHRMLGFNHRLDAMQAIALELKLPYVAEATVARKTAAARYDELLEPLANSFKTVKVATGAEHVYHLYVIQSLKMNRDEVRKNLAELGVGTEIHYPLPVYKQPFYNGPVDLCPVTDEVISKVISLPMYPEITNKEQEYVVQCLKAL